MYLLLYLLYLSIGVVFTVFTYEGSIRVYCIYDEGTIVIIAIS